MTETELDPEALNNTNLLELRVFAREELGQAVLTARLDNLGIGAAGTAVRNLELMMVHGEGDSFGESDHFRDRTGRNG